MVEQTKITYSSLEKVLEKQTKTIEEKGEKQIKVIKNRVEKEFLDTDEKSVASLFSKDFLNEETLYELNKIVVMENKLSRYDLVFQTGNKKEG